MPKKWVFSAIFVEETNFLEKSGGQVFATHLTLILQACNSVENRSNGFLLFPADSEGRYLPLIKYFFQETFEVNFKHWLSEL